MQWPPHVTVGTIVEDQGKFLVIREIIANKPVLHYPAGHLEFGESLIQAAKREALEETGWQIDITHFLNINQLYSQDENIIYIHFNFVGNPVKKVDGLPSQKAILAVDWLDFSSLKKQRHLMRTDRFFQSLEQFNQGLLFPLSIIHDEQFN